MTRLSDFENNFFQALDLHEQGKPSIKIYKDLLEQEPGNSILNYLLSSAYNILRDKKNAKKFYKKAVNLNSNIDFAENYENTGQIIKLAYGLYYHQKRIRIKTQNSKNL